MRPPGRGAVTFYRAFRTSARRSVYARVRSLSMEQIGARELRANLAAALRQASAGERGVVTVDGRPVAQLGPLEASGTRSLAELAASGLVEPPRGPDRPVRTEARDAAVDVGLDRVLAEEWATRPSN